MQLIPTDKIMREQIKLRTSLNVDSLSGTSFFIAPADTPYVAQMLACSPLFLPFGLSIGAFGTLLCWLTAYASASRGNVTKSPEKIQTSLRSLGTFSVIGGSS